MWGWTMGKDETLATIWEIPDHLWEQIHPVILDMDPPKSTGRKRADPRRMLDGIIFRMRSGCQWNRLPRELGDDSTIHRTFQRWVELGVLEGIWAVLVEGCEELGGVDWEWQSADCSMGKARLGGAPLGRNPTDRGKAGSKKSILVDAAGRTPERGGGWSQRARYETLEADPGEHRSGAPGRHPEPVLGQRV